jgi:hypothetical protein
MMLMQMLMMMMRNDRIEEGKLVFMYQFVVDRAGRQVAGSMVLPIARG